MHRMVELETSERDPVGLYEVFNTSHRSLLVMAKDRDSALNIAWAACHIRHTDNGLLSEGRSVHEARAKFYAPICERLQRAISRGLQGTVSVINDVVYVGQTEIEA